MKPIKYFVFFLIILSSSSSSYAQERIHESFELGLKAFDAKQYASSVQYFSKCISHKYDMENSYLFRCLSYKGLKQFSPQAIDDITQAIHLQPNDEVLYLFRGMLYREMGEYEKAIAEFSYSLSINPTSSAYTNTN